MSEPFAGEIRMFAGNFAPRGWAYCDGQLLAVSQNDALFSLLGTIYGGDGRTTFGLPDLRGRLPIHAGSGPGLSARKLGGKGGAETETVTVNQMPSHEHPMQASSDSANTPNPQGNVLSLKGDRNPTNLAAMRSDTVVNAGGGQGHNNMQPYLAINFAIALQGLYPSRN